MCQLCEKQGDQVSFTHFHLLLHPKCTPWDIPAWAVGLDKITSKGPFQPQSLSSSPRTMTGTGKKTECCFPHTVWFLPFLSSPVSAKKSSSFSCTIFPVVLGSCPLFCQLEPERLAYSSDLPVSKLLLWQISVLKLTNIEGNFLSLGTVVQIRAVLGLVGFTLCQTVRDHHWMFYTIGEKCTREGVWSLFGGISACLTSLFLPPAAHTLVCGGECFKQSKLKSVKISLAGTTSVPSWRWFCASNNGWCHPVGSLGEMPRGWTQPAPRSDEVVLVAWALDGSGGVQSFCSCVRCQTCLSLGNWGYLNSLGLLDLPLLIPLQSTAGMAVGQAWIGAVR